MGACVWQLLDLSLPKPIIIENQDTKSGKYGLNKEPECLG